MGNDLSVTVEKDEPEQLILVIAGELDLNTVVDLRNYLHDNKVAATYETIVLDMSKICYVDSAGNGVLAGIKRQFSGHDKPNALTVRNPSRAVEAAMLLSGLNKIIQIEGLGTWQSRSEPQPLRRKRKRVPASVKALPTEMPLYDDSDDEPHDWVVVTAPGDFDVYKCVGVKRQIIQLINNKYVWIKIDLSLTEYLDGTAIGVLIGGLKRARERDGEIRIVCESPRIHRIFAITGLTKIFDRVTLKENDRTFESLCLPPLELNEVQRVKHRVRTRSNKRGDGSMTVGEAGRKGGEITAMRFGSEYYSNIGRKGGQTVAERHGKEFYSEIGRKGAQRLKEIRAERSQINS